MDFRLIWSRRVTALSRAGCCPILDVLVLFRQIDRTLLRAQRFQRFETMRSSPRVCHNRPINCRDEHCSEDGFGVASALTVFGSGFGFQRGRWRDPSIKPSPNAASTNQPIFGTKLLASAQTHA